MWKLGELFQLSGLFSHLLKQIEKEYYRVLLMVVRTIVALTQWGVGIGKDSCVLGDYLVVSSCLQVLTSVEISSQKAMVLPIWHQVCNHVSGFLGEVGMETNPGLPAASQAQGFVPVC